MARVSLLADNQIAIALTNHVLLFEDENTSKLPILLKYDVSSSSSQDNNATVIAMCFNMDKTKLAVIYSDKLLRTWDCMNGNMIAVQKLPKKLSSVTIAPIPENLKKSCGIEVVLVGDKTGDVYSLSFPNLDKRKLMMGHTASIITSINILPPSSTFNHYMIATSDRDEKIRLSYWPQTNLIHSYCLGHLEYISNVMTSIQGCYPLISTSGDKTIRSWNPETGQCLSMHTCTEGVPLCMARYNNKNLNDDFIVISFANSKTISFMNLSNINLDQTSTSTMEISNTMEVSQVPTNMGFTSNGALLILCAEAPYFMVLNRSLSSDNNSSNTSDYVISSNDDVGTQIQSIIKENGLKVLSALSLDDNELKDNTCIVDVADQQEPGGGGDFVPGVNELRKRAVDRPCTDWNSKKRLNWQGNSKPKGDEEGAAAEEEENK